MEINKIYCGESLEILKTFENESIDMVMTSPPYYNLRDYQIDGQLGLEETPEEYIKKLCDIFDEVKKVLKKQGTIYVNLGDSYGTKSGGMEQLKKQGKDIKQYGKIKYKFEGVEQKGKNQHKSLLQIPSKFAIEMTNRKWILRNEIIWWKPNCMPSSADDRFTVDYEKIYFFSKNSNYYFNQQLQESIWARHDKRFITGPTSGGKAVSGNYAINKGDAFRKDGMRNMRSVWYIPTKNYSESHFAIYPEELCEIPIKSSCPDKGIVLDPFMGSGTTAYVARQLGRNYVGIELNSEYIKLANKRLAQQNLFNLSTSQNSL